MGGNYSYYNNNNSGQKKSSTSSSTFCMFNMFKSFKRSRTRVDDYYYGGEEAPCGRRVWPSDEDRGRWPVAEPGIDRRAEDFIAKIHRNIATDLEPKTFTIPNTTAKE